MNITWREIIEQVDPSVAVFTGFHQAYGPSCIIVDTSNLETFAHEFNYHCDYGWDEEFSRRMVKHWVISWICTDTRVGYAVYCLDGQVVAVSERIARKSHEEILFLSSEHVRLVHDVVVETIAKSDNPLDRVSLVELDSLIPNLTNTRGY